MLDQTITLLIERIERCEMDLQSARAYIKALEQGLHAAIVTHGDPLRMGELWGHVLVEIAEGQTDGPETGPVPFRACVIACCSRQPSDVGRLATLTMYAQAL